MNIVKLKIPGPFGITINCNAFDLLKCLYLNGKSVKIELIAEYRNNK